MQATVLLVWIRFHIGTKQPWNSLRPKKNNVQYLKVVVGFTGLPPRPTYQDSHGHTVDRHGVPSFSHAPATGLVVSGVEVVRIMSTLFCRIICRATAEARVGFVW